jgi:hypothetical protein
MQFAKLAGSNEEPAYFAGKKTVAEKPSHRSIVVIAQFARFESDARTKCRQARTRNSILGTPGDRKRERFAARKLLQILFEKSSERAGICAAYLPGPSVLRASIASS